MALSANNKGDVIPTANDTVEVFINQSGTNQVTNPHIWYINLQRHAMKVAVRVDKISQITEINGETLDTPIAIVANGSFQDVIRGFHYHKYVQLKIKVLNDTTNVEVFART